MSELRPDYDDDPFSSTRMSLGDHIEELRSALWKAIKGFVIAMLVGFFVADSVMHFLARPIEKQLMVFYDQQLEKRKAKLEEDRLEIPPEKRMTPIHLRISREETRTALGLPPGDSGDSQVVLIAAIDPIEMTTITSKTMKDLLRPPLLRSLTVTEVFVVWMKVCILTGFVLGSPWIFYQVWMFIGAGLYPHEKKLVHVYLPFSLILFFAGAALCQFFVLPIGISYLLSFNAWLNIEPELRLTEWLSFAIIMPVAFGVSFQTPLVMFFAHRVGIVEVDTFKNYRKIAIFVLFFLSALLVASGDPISMLSMAVPLVLLYELGIILCRLSPRPGLDLDIEEPDDIVEA